MHADRQVPWAEEAFDKVEDLSSIRSRAEEALNDLR